MIEEVIDFTVSTVRMNMDDWGKLPLDMRNKLEAYGSDFHYEKGGHVFAFEIASYRLKELGLPEFNGT